MLVALLAVACTAAPGPRRAAVADAAVAARVLTAVNGHREAIGRARLVADPRLGELAREHSLAMARGERRLGHGGFRERIAAYRATGEARRAAENVVLLDPKSSPVPERSLALWLASGSHRRNLEGSWIRTGVGAARVEDGHWYVTQIFVVP